MKSIIFYFSTVGSNRGNSFAVWQRGEIVGYVRAEQRNCDADAALDKAKPRKGETVLNSVEILETPTKTTKEL